MDIHITYKPINSFSSATKKKGGGKNVNTPETNFYLGLTSK
jgi:hypothetical protein